EVAGRAGGRHGGWRRSDAAAGTAGGEDGDRLLAAVAKRARRASGAVRRRHGSGGKRSRRARPRPSADDAVPGRRQVIFGMGLTLAFEEFNRSPSAIPKHTDVAFLGQDLLGTPG
ncbi:hypothetical protein THAOC_22417, partial [Thalassiosira oceanica]